MTSPVTRIADDYVEALAAHEPAAAQSIGRTDGPDLPDLSIEWFLERYELEGRVLEQLAALPADTEDSVLRAAMIERLTSNRAFFDSGFTPRMVAGLASPLHLIRENIEGITITPDAAGEALIRRIEGAPHEIEEYTRTLRWAREQGEKGRFTGTGVAAARQVDALATQTAAWAASNYFGTLPADPNLDAETTARVERAAAAINEALVAFSTFLREDLLPTAPLADGVGEAVYQTMVEGMLGTETIDLRETYAFGWSELHRLVAEARSVAIELGGTGVDPVRSAAELLDADPSYRLESIESITEWLSTRVEETIVALDGTAFDMPGNIRDVDCLVSQASSGVVYYTPGPPDGSSNSRIVWTIPSGIPVAASWQEVTSVHHEGAPGHHLEHSINRANLSLHPWQRYLCEVHGYAEGWAHYAEALSEELGLIRDPAERLGMLLGQIWRAVRIVADIGMHTDWEIPATPLTDATRWTPELARDFLVDFAMVEPELATFEVDRYLGIAGQALAFKVGAKLWMDARAEWKAARGEDFSLKEFHREALSYGPMGLGPLRTLLLAP